MARSVDQWSALGNESAESARRIRSFYVNEPCKGVVVPELRESCAVPFVALAIRHTAITSGGDYEAIPAAGPLRTFSRTEPNAQ